MYCNHIHFNYYKNVKLKKNFSIILVFNKIKVDILFIRIFEKCMKEKLVRFGYLNFKIQKIFVLF